MITLYVLSDYRSRRIEHVAGTAIVVSQEEADRLLADSPGSFTLATPIEPDDPEPEVLVTAPDAPPIDKQVRRRR